MKPATDPCGIDGCIRTTGHPGRHYRPRTAGGTRTKPARKTTTQRQPRLIPCGTMTVKAAPRPLSATGADGPDQLEQVQRVIALCTLAGIEVNRMVDQPRMLVITTDRAIAL
jgi:hypothetical protein